MASRKKSVTSGNKESTVRVDLGSVFAVRTGTTDRLEFEAARRRRRRREPVIATDIPTRPANAVQSFVEKFDVNNDAGFQKWFAKLAPNEPQE
jgi:hypothetical protein